MVRIRLARYGRKGRPFYRIVAIHSRRSREGEALCNLGFFDPIQKQYKLHLELFDKYISQGAQMSDRVESLYKKHLATIK
jgi:small subunit ribosomal protein S16